MNPRKQLIIVAAVLQIAMVLSGHFSPAVLALSAVLGVGIPLAVGIWYGMRHATSTGDAFGSGFLIGIVGAAFGVLLAILLGDQPWLLLTFAPLSSGVAGLLGSAVLFSVVRRKQLAAAES